MDGYEQVLAAIKECQVPRAILWAKKRKTQLNSAALPTVDKKYVKKVLMALLGRKAVKRMGNSAALKRFRDELSQSSVTQDSADADLWERAMIFAWGALNEQAERWLDPSRSATPAAVQKRIN